MASFTSCGSLSLDCQQLHLEDQRGVGADLVTRAARTVAELGGG